MMKQVASEYKRRVYKYGTSNPKYIYLENLDKNLDIANSYLNF